MKERGTVREQSERESGTGSKLVDGTLQQAGQVIHSSHGSDPRRWGVLALLFASIAINLLDRQVLSVLAPVIRDDLGLSATEYSYVVASFLLGLTLAQLPAGMFLDRKGPRLGLPLIMIWWSAANALHALARGVGHLCAFRFLLGVGECGNYSAGVKVISMRFPPQERALAGGIFNAGTVIGAFVAPAIIVWIQQRYGWRMGFVLPSVLGLLWIIPWLRFYRDTRQTATQSGAPVALLPLLARREVWGAMLIRALAGPVVHFYWYWLPEYLKRERNFSMDMIGLMAGIPFLFAGLGNVVGGWFSGYLMTQLGWSVDRARKTAFGAAGALCTISILVPAVPGEVLPLVLISTATFGLAMSVANHIGLLTDLFEPRVLARLTGLSGACEGVINIAVTLATGRVVDQFGYLPVFAAAGLMPVAAVSCLFLLVRRVQPVR